MTITQDKIDEIMEEVRMYGAAWFVSGQQSISDKDALYFESKAQGHLLEIQSKLRELVREPLSDDEICTMLGIDGSDDWTYTVARAVERAHNITNTKETP